MGERLRLHASVEGLNERVVDARPILERIRSRLIASRWNGLSALRVMVGMFPGAGRASDLRPSNGSLSTDWQFALVSWPAAIADEKRVYQD